MQQKLVERIRVNEVYRTFMGEVNPFGIGHPAVFVRTAGCHLRCYKETYDVLCDTPHALEKDSGKLYSIGGGSETYPDIFDAIKSVGGDIKLICLTGGDPLWRSTQSIREFLRLARTLQYKVVVETSGTLSWLPFHELATWVIDYKLPSAGVHQKCLLLDEAHLKVLDSQDYIKFVIANERDFAHALDATEEICRHNDQVKIAFGPLYGIGAELTFWDINELLNHKKYVSPQIVLNLQLHKLHPGYTDAMQI